MINGKVYPWGPFLWESEVDQDFCNELLERAKKTNIKHNASLVGHIDEEYKYLEEDTLWCAKKLEPYVECYLKQGDAWYKNLIGECVKNKNMVNLNLLAVWINYMKKGEFNPLHYHDGHITFVIYLQVPESLKKESYLGSGAKPGSIIFNYGEPIHNFIIDHAFTPEERKIFIFPSQLRHTVYPFRSDETRISVSGNFILS